VLVFYWLVASFACGPEPATVGPTDAPPADTGTSPTTPPDTGVFTDPNALVLGPEVVCADPGPRAEAAFDVTVHTVPSTSDLWIWGGGAIAVDLDCDGDLDIVLPGEDGGGALLNDGTGAFDADDDFFGDVDLSWGTGGSVADMDGDGDLDLLYTRFDQPNVLLRNDDCAWTDVTASAFPDDEVVIDAAAVPPPTVSARTAYKTMVSSWADLDHDGDLDLYVGNYGFVDESGAPTEDFLPADPNLLLLNRGDGTFDNASDRLPVEVHDCYDYAGGFLDLTGDGWPEIYTVCDFGVAYPNAMLTNVGGQFHYDPFQSNGLQGLDVTGMGLGIADLNGDATPDLLISEWNKFKLFQSSGDFWLQVLDAGIDPDAAADQKVAWGTEFVDVDNDGDEDVPVAFGYVDNSNPIWRNPLRQPDALYVNDGAGSFHDAAAAAGFDQDGVARGFAVADFNGDGYPDFFKRDLLGDNTVHLSRCGSDAFLDVSLMAETGNRHGIGAVVEVTAGGTTQRRWITAGGLNYASGHPPTAHFGLGAATTVDLLEVLWPDGLRSRFESVDVRRSVVVQRP
jgi:hypothetical protein